MCIILANLIIKHSNDMLLKLSDTISCLLKANSLRYFIILCPKCTWGFMYQSRPLQDLRLAGTNSAMVDGFFNASSPKHKLEDLECKFLRFVKEYQN